MLSREMWSFGRVRHMHRLRIWCTHNVNGPKSQKLIWGFLLVPIHLSIFWINQFESIIQFSSTFFGTTENNFIETSLLMCHSRLGRPGSWYYPFCYAATEGHESFAAVRMLTCVEATSTCEHSTLTLTERLAPLASSLHLSEGPATMAHPVMSSFLASRRPPFVHSVLAARLPSV